MTTAIRHRLICAVSAVALAIPCLAAHQAPEPQQPAAVSPLQPPAAQAPETPVYILQAGDELEIKAFNLPELDHKVRIRPDGKISLPLDNYYGYWGGWGWGWGAPLCDQGERLS